jgi:hypothetical protein
MKSDHATFVDNYDAYISRRAHRERARARLGRRVELVLYVALAISLLGFAYAFTMLSLTAERRPHARFTLPVVPGRDCFNRGSCALATALE